MRVLLPREARTAQAAFSMARERRACGSFAALKVSPP